MGVGIDLLQIAKIRPGADGDPVGRVRIVDLDVYVEGYLLNMYTS
jgi:hypothetical protein